MVPLTARSNHAQPEAITMTFGISQKMLFTACSTSTQMLTTHTHYSVMWSLALITSSLHMPNWVAEPEGRAAPT